MDKSKVELADLGRELRYTQQVVASELASWQDNRVETGRKALKELARKMVVSERARLESMKRAIRELGIGDGRKKGERPNGVAVESNVAEPIVEIHSTPSDTDGGSVDGLMQDLENVMLPQEDGPQLEDLVEGLGDVADEETPLLDLAAEAPEQLDDTIIPTSGESAPSDRASDE